MQGMVKVLVQCFTRFETRARIQGCAGVVVCDFGKLYLRDQNRSQLSPVRHIRFYNMERNVTIFQCVKWTNVKVGNDI
jgi:hypothetical protein